MRPEVMLEKVNITNRRSGPQLNGCDKCTGAHRRDFIGGSDARVIMGRHMCQRHMLITKERNWERSSGPISPRFSCHSRIRAFSSCTNLIVQLGLVTEDLNRQRYERNTGNAIKNVQSRVKHPVIRWMAATLDGVVEQTGAVYEAKFMLPWSFSEEFAAEKYMAQLQHNMWVTHARMAALSIITGGGKWVEISIAADQLYQHLLLTAEKKFWRCVQFGDTPRLFGVEPPRPRIEAVPVRRHGFLERLGGVRGAVLLHPVGLPRP